jgi:methionyl-tRNA formyltransferase
MNIVIATLKSWNVEKALKIKEQYEGVINVEVITQKEDLSLSNLVDCNPDYIFFPHWSYIIPKEIYERFDCIVFHMTDLPFGRGGSPLQNLIVCGIKNTKITALKVVGELDAGPIYMKKPLALDGTAEEIFRRSSDIIFHHMIPEIIKERPIPVPQIGEVISFKRRKPEESELGSEFTPDKIYDYIRMLDAEGYPKAFIRFGNYKLEFSNAELNANEVTAKVIFRRNEDA